MIYLLAKYTLLIALAAVAGFIFGYWFSRRNIEDVSENFEDLRRANRRSDETNWDRLWGQLKAMPEPKETDLAGVYERLDGVTSAVSRLPKPKSPDLQPLVDKLHKLETEIKAIPTPEKPLPVDFSPLTAKIDALQVAVRSIPKTEPQRDIDLEPIQTELNSLRSDIQKIPAVETHAPVDLAPVRAQIESLHNQVSSLPQPKAVDLAPIDRRLNTIEAELSSLGKRIADRARTEREPRVASRNASREQPRILSAALYGKKDNLRMISGVGPKLESLLNKNGIYYFWQVAEWRDRDIEIMDARLDAFKGRIGRDSWVAQADELRQIPEAARMPADL